jgi:hypothetical protein
LLSAQRKTGVMERFANLDVKEPLDGGDPLNELVLESTEIRVETYRRRSEAAESLASRASIEDVAASYRRLADCWGKLAAAVERTETPEKRDAA